MLVHGPGVGTCQVLDWSTPRADIFPRKGGYGPDFPSRFSSPRVKLYICIRKILLGILTDQQLYYSRMTFHIIIPIYQLFITTFILPILLLRLESRTFHAEHCFYCCSPIQESIFTYCSASFVSTSSSFSSHCCLKNIKRFTTRFITSSSSEYGSIILL